ncbi:MAG: T9SS type A sorting domain-containing protein [Fluviicola sp.]
MRKFILIFLGVILFSMIAPTISFGQSSNPNMNGWHAKYWFYRWRLRNDFMVMGEEDGQSLIADTRNRYRGQYMVWGDAMIMHGYYLTMLALEHKILEDKGRWADLKNNERELYYAIKAFERLDYNSETFYSAVSGNNDDVFRAGDEALPPDVNGYFFRDDVPPTFLNTDPDIDGNNAFTPNYHSLTNEKTGIDYGLLTYNQSDYSGLWGSGPNGDDGVSSDPPNLDFPQYPIVNYKKGYDDDVYGYGEESQDQAIRLLLGFFTIIKSIPNYTYSIDKDKDGTTDVNMNFYEEAQRHSTNIIGRMAGYFSGTTVVGPGPVSILPHWGDALGAVGAQFWQIENPRHDQVSIGGAPYIYMTPMQIVSIPLFTTANDLSINSGNYATLSYNSSSASIWNLGLNGYTDFVNSKMALILNVISNSGSGFLPVPRFVANKSANDNIDGLYVPLYDYFWDWNPTDNENDVERKEHAYNYANLMLEAAPCVGPHNFGYTRIINPRTGSTEPVYSAVQDPDGIPYYWNVPFVFDNEHTIWDDGYKTNGTDTLITEGWFSGVDYMLLYNLIYANNDGDKPLYHDLINRVVDYDINTDLYSSLYGYSATGLMIGAFENLKVSGNIYGNTPVTLKALDFVQLDEGLYDPNNMPDGITVEVGKITCGNNFTSSNTPYSIDQCQTCGLDNQIGSFVAPVASGKDHSLPIKIPKVSELEQYASLNQRTSVDTATENEVTVFPNPTTDFLQLATSREISEMILQNQNGAEVKRFVAKKNLYDIRDLASGVYTIILTFNNHETKHIKIVKF